MKKSLYALISISLIGMMSGCGSSSVSQGRSNLQEPIIPTAQKMTRANWTGVAPVSEGFFITNDDNLLSFKLQDASIASHDARAMTVLIDADNNPNTGYIHGHGAFHHIGAEYMVQNNQLYRYEGNGWHWTFIGEVSQRDTADDERELEFAQNMIHTGDTIRAVGILNGQNWDPIRVTDAVSYRLREEVANPTPNGYSVSDDATQLIFQIQSSSIAQGLMHTNSIFIDSDNSAQTGYHDPNWGNIGAEYLIEDDRLYEHIGDAGWHWRFLAQVERRVEGDSVQVRVNQDLLHLANRIQTVAGILNNDWQVIERYDVAPYTLEDHGEDGAGGEGGGQTPDSRLNVTDHGDTLTLTLHNDQLHTAPYRTDAIFIDADHNPQSGYTNPDYSLGTMGAEYLITEHDVYEHNGGGWSWTLVGHVDPQESDSDITITIPKDMLHLSATIRVMGSLINQEWHPYAPAQVQDITLVTPDNAHLTVSHDLAFFWFTIADQNRQFNANTHTEFYIDEDDNPNTGVPFNGIGAEYRIVDNQAFALRGDGEWGEPFNDQPSQLVRTVQDHQITVRPTRAQMSYTHRHIAVSARVLDANNEEIFRVDPVHYEVRADNDEITLSYRDPAFYIVQIHNPMIDPAHFGQDPQDGNVWSLHVAIDADNNHFTGNQMNAVGADYFTHSLPTLQHTYHFRGLEGADSWIDRWDVVEGGDTHLEVQNGLVEVFIPRAAMQLGDHFTIASTLNNSEGRHFYWTNRYEFTLQ